jgi:hypothetical protein
MVYESEPHDQDDSSRVRLRSSVIGPWIASSTDVSDNGEAEELISGSGSDQLDISQQTTEQQEVMLEVGNLIMIDQDDEHALSGLNSSPGPSVSDAIVEQSIVQTRAGALELTTEPQIVSEVYLDRNDGTESQDIITVNDYSRVLELSHPFEFSIPSVVEQQENQTSNLENFIEEFEDSLSRIDDLQREINEIRELYNNLVQEDGPIETPEIAEIQGEDAENTLDPDAYEDENILSPIVDERSRLEGIGSFSQFFQQLSQTNEDEFDVEEDEQAHFIEQSDDDEGSEDLPLVSTSWRFENGAIIRRQFPNQIIRMRNNLLPNFYLDSNGIPRIEFERQINFRSRNIFSNDYSSKAAPFCRIDSNGDIECIVASYRPNALGELKVEVYDKIQKTADTILFKEIRNNWRNDHGECIGR